MKRIRADETLDQLVNDASALDEPVFIRGSGASALLVSVAQWRSLRETLYLLSIPGMRDSILKGMAAPIEECSEDPGWGHSG